MKKIKIRCIEFVVILRIILSLVILLVYCQCKTISKFNQTMKKNVSTSLELQSALASLNSSIVSVIEIEPGTYNINANYIISRSNIKITGIGDVTLNLDNVNGTIKPNTPLLAFVADTAPITNSTPPIYNIEVSNIKFKGNKIPIVSIIQLNRVENFSINKCNFYDCGLPIPPPPSHPQLPPPPGWCDCIAASNRSMGEVSSCKFYNASKNSIFVSVGCKFINVHNNFIDGGFIGQNRPGIELRANGFVSGNLIQNCSGAGILAISSDPGSVSSETTDSKLDTRSFANIVTGNQIVNCDIGRAVEATTVYDRNITTLGYEPREDGSVITNNVIIDPITYGISTLNRNGLIITGNSIINTNPSSPNNMKSSMNLDNLTNSIVTNNILGKPRNEYFFRGSSYSQGNIHTGTPDN